MARLRMNSSCLVCLCVRWCAITAQAYPGDGSYYWLHGSNTIGLLLTSRHVWAFLKEMDMICRRHNDDTIMFLPFLSDCDMKAQHLVAILTRAIGCSRVGGFFVIELNSIFVFSWTLSNVRVSGGISKMAGSSNMTALVWILSYMTRWSVYERWRSVTWSECGIWPPSSFVDWPENVGITVGIVLLPCIQAQI